jgi:hypothetical protein
MSRRSRRAKASKPRPIRTLLFGGGFFLILLYIGLSFVLPTLTWAAGGGTHGTFVARDESCTISPRHGHTSSCRWYGDFTGTSGQPAVHHADATNDTARPLHAGERLPGIYTTTRIFVIPGRAPGLVFLGPRSPGDIFSTDVLGPFALALFAAGGFVARVLSSVRGARQLWFHPARPDGWPAV